MKIIPVPNRRIRRLSGFQQHCINMATTMFDDPTRRAFWANKSTEHARYISWLLDNQQARINRAISHFRRPLPGPVAETNPHGYLPTPHGDLPSLLRYERTWRARDPYAAVRTRIRRNLTGVW